MLIINGEESVIVRRVADRSLVALSDRATLAEHFGPLRVRRISAGAGPFCFASSITETQLQELLTTWTKTL